MTGRWVVNPKGVGLARQGSSEAQTFGLHVIFFVRTYEYETTGTWLAVRIVGFILGSSIRRSRSPT